MPDWSTLRRRAQQHHERLRRQLPEGTPFLPSAEALLSAAEEDTGMTRIGVPPDDSLLAGAHAVLDRHGECIWYAEDAAPESRWFSQAHEFAHFWLHPDIQRDACHVEDNPDLFLAPESLSYSAQMEIGYSPAERRESEANHFAAEFLLPAPSLRRALQEGWTVPDIMAQVGVSETLVLAQLAQNVMLAPMPLSSDSPSLATQDTPPNEKPRQVISLDASQQVAATIARGPVLVEAGPGTGKTRALIARLLYLLTERQVLPENILALTFSNKAAEEMRTRLEDAVGDLAARVWIGTFHAFGMEVLRKDGHRIGLPLSPKLLETADAILLLERHLDRLALDEYEYLFQPSLPFPDLLHCISRAKDELQTPEDYRAAAWQQRCTATKDEETLVARKSLEVAHFYAVYQEIMARYGYVDFGDLIARSVELLDKHPDVRERWQQQFPHILADEYQDINRASAQFLRRLAASGEGFWAVGDVRQAIYRFRGASPANVEQFETDFPGGRRVPLQVNYRSRPSLVSLFSATATQMLPSCSTSPSTPLPEGEGRQAHAGTFSPLSPRSEETGAEETLRLTSPLSPAKRESGEGAGGEVQNVLWDAHRAEEGSPTITLAIAENEEAQADGLAATIRGWERAGVPLPEQTILCRTNRQAAELAEQLEARGVPTQHLGSLFEREEVKDLLAVLSLGCEREGAALLRVARLPEYAVPQEDVQHLWKAAKEARRVFPGALELAHDLPELSEEGRAGLQRLRAHIAPIAYRGDAWYFLTRYLFVMSGYLRPILNDDSITAKQKALAIHQLLAFAQRLTKKLPPEEGQSQHAAFLVYLRHLLACGEERSIRLPSGVERLNGVRLMTVHASKGLEFPVVYLPNLVKDMFPTRKMGRMASPPPELFGTTGEGVSAANDDEAGEECLFFVALSRARDHLVLSRPALRRGREAQPSPLLKSIEETLVACNAERVIWQRATHLQAEGKVLAVQHEEDDTSAETTTEAATTPEAARPTVSLSALEQYQNCPRQYYYQRISRVPMRGGKSAYQAFHESLNTTQKWLQEERAAGNSPSLVETHSYLEAHWMANAPEVESAQARVLHEHALAMLEVAHRNIAEAPAVLPAMELTAELPNGSVRLRCDHAEPQADGTLKLAQSVKRRPKKDDHTAPDLALLREAARQQHPDKQVEISLHYLRDGSRREIPENPRYEPKRVEKYDLALAGIRTHRFPAQPDDRKCPQCPFFFLCPNG